MKFFRLFLIIALFTACSPKIVPTSTTVVQYRDTTIFQTDTIKVPLPVERVVEVVPQMDTLRLSTTLADARAWVDTTTRTLRGEIQNKNASLSKEVEVPTHIHTRDSVVTVEVPVNVEVPVKVYPKWLIIISILGAVVLASEVMRLFIK